MNKKELPKRKNLRLQNYNYNGNGIYFITICTKDKKRIFGKYDVGAIHELPEKHAKNRCVQLNLYGQIVENAITKLPKRYNEIEVVNYNDIINYAKEVRNIEGIFIGISSGAALSIAIKEAQKIAGEKDIVLIAGKGHEDYQILANETIHFDDREKVRLIFG